MLLGGDSEKKENFMGGVTGLSHLLGAPNLGSGKDGKDHWLVVGLLEITGWLWEPGLWS